MKYNKKILLMFLSLVFLFGCASNHESNENSNITIGENGNWHINGEDTNIKAKGEDGRETTFRVNNGVLEWKYVGDSEWIQLIVLEEKENQEEYTKGLILNEVTGKGYSVIGYEGDEEEITIPSSYKGTEIYKIEDNAFASSHIKKIRIGKNVKVLGESSFEGASELETVEFDKESKLEEIGDTAFYNCKNLTYCNVPSSLKRLGRCAFFILDNLICEYDDIYGVKYIGNDENPFLILYDSVSSNITECVVNTKCKFIADYSFTYCSKLNKITIPEGVISIGDSALYSCGSLKEVKIPSTVQYIGNATFNCSSAIESFIVDEDNKTYDSRDNSNAIIETKTNTLMYGCKNTIIPESITSIRDKAWYGNGEVESVFIPKNVTKIGEYVFSMCTNLSELKVDKDNKTFKSIDNSNNECNVIIQKGSYTQTLLYGGANEDGTLVIPSGVTSIGIEAFRGRLKLTEITIPKTVTTIKDYAFDYCQNLKTINNASKLVFEINSSTYGGIARYATTINII